MSYYNPYYRQQQPAPQSRPANPSYLSYQSAQPHSAYTPQSHPGYPQPQPQQPQAQPTKSYPTPGYPYPTQPQPTPQTYYSYPQQQPQPQLQPQPQPPHQAYAPAQPQRYHNYAPPPPQQAAYSPTYAGQPQQATAYSQPVQSSYSQPNQPVSYAQHQPLTPQQQHPPQPQPQLRPQPQPQPQSPASYVTSTPTASPTRRALPTPTPRTSPSTSTFPQSQSQKSEFVPSPSRVKTLESLPNSSFDLTRRHSLQTQAQARTVESIITSLPSSSFDISSPRTGSRSQSVDATTQSPTSRKTTSSFPSSSFDLPIRRGSLSKGSGRPLPKPPGAGGQPSAQNPTPPTSPVKSPVFAEPDSHSHTATRLQSINEDEGVAEEIQSTPKEERVSSELLEPLEEENGIDEDSAVGIGILRVENVGVSSEEVEEKETYGEDGTDEGELSKEDNVQSEEEPKDTEPETEDRDKEEEDDLHYFSSEPGSPILKIKTPPKFSSEVQESDSESEDEYVILSRVPTPPPLSSRPVLSPPPTFQATPPQTSGEPQSMALRLAKLSLMEEEEEEQQHRKKQWPAGIPRLPKLREPDWDRKKTIELDDTPPKSLRGSSASRNSRPLPASPSPRPVPPIPSPATKRRASPPPPPRPAETQVPVINLPSEDNDEDNIHVPSISIMNSPAIISITSSVPTPPSRRTSSGTGVGRGLRCAGCDSPIVGRIVSAMGRRWHPGCFKCEHCGELLEHVSSFEHEGRAYCHLDYHEHFAPRCHHCQTPIADERFITINDPALGPSQRYYHELHFFCAECGDPFLDPSLSSAAPKVSGKEHLVESDDVGFTIYQGHPYCEACHVRLRMPKCGSRVKGGGAGGNGFGCGKAIREEALEALGRKWHWDCFVCESCKKPFEDPSYFQRDDKAYCDPCFRLVLKNEIM